MDVTDREAVERVLKGQQDAFDILVERYGEVLTALAYGHLGDLHDAQDAVQDTFLTAYESLDALRDPDAFAAWIARMLRNICLMRQRSRHIRKRATQRLEESAPRTHGNVPLDHMMADEREAALRKAVDRLSEPLREAILLRYLAGQRRAEAAAVLDIEIATLDKRTERALRELRTQMDDNT